MFRKLFFLITLALAAFGCDKAQNGSTSPGGQPPGQNTDRRTSELSDENQRLATAAFYKMAGGQWTQDCKNFENSSSVMSYLKFASENSGDQKIVTYKSKDCEGDDFNYEIKTFKYQITSVQTTTSQGADLVDYGVSIQFDEPKEKEASSLDTVFRISEGELTYKILHKNGENSFIKLKPFQNVPIDQSEDATP